ncbi:MAG: hypothetical protein AAF191_10625 [Verrucomicrobiota bacterium]
MKELSSEIRRLLATRRVEPGGDYCAEFLKEFHERQRRELASLSAGAILWERVVTWWAAERGKLWMTGGAVSLVVILAAVGTTAVISASAKKKDDLAQRPAVTAEHDEIQQDGFQGWVGVEETRAFERMENSIVQVGWEGASHWTPGFQVGDGMFVSVRSKAEPDQAVRLFVAEQPSEARIVLVDQRSGMVVIEAKPPVRQ